MPPPPRPQLSLERRAQLARETVGLIRWLADSLVESAEEARQRCERGGNPQPVADEIAEIAEQAQRLRGQVEQISRGFVVLDRLIPPAAPTARPAPAPRRHPAPRSGADRPPTGLDAHDETRAAAAAFAVGLRLEGATRQEVEARLIGEFDRRDAHEIADEAFGR